MGICRFVGDFPGVFSHYDMLSGHVATVGYEILKNQNSMIRGYQEQLYAGPAEEDVQPLSRRIDECFDTMLDEFENLKRAIEDIFNPVDEEYGNT